jgi:hypothetical protein
MRMKGFRRNAGTGRPGRYESVTEAAKNGFSSSGRNALNVDVREPVGTNSNRARCFGISDGRTTSTVVEGAKKREVTHTPVIAPIPDTLKTAHVDVRDAPRGALLVRVGPSVRNSDKLVVRSHGRVLVTDENDIIQTALPLRCVVDGTKGRGVHRLRGAVRTSRETLQDWVLPIAWTEQLCEEIKLGTKQPRCGGRRHASRGRGL